MNFQNNGHHDQGKGSNGESNDDVKLTAMALGELTDPQEIDRLKSLLAKDESKRKEFESTVQLASMIRDSVENDLPLAPGSIHDVVLAALESPAASDPDSDFDQEQTNFEVNATSNSPRDDASFGASGGKKTIQTEEKVAVGGLQQWWNNQWKTVSYVSALSVMVIASIWFLQSQQYLSTSTGIARAELDESKANELNVEKLASKSIPESMGTLVNELSKSPVDPRSENAGSANAPSAKFQLGQLAEKEDSVDDRSVVEEFGMKKAKAEQSNQPLKQSQSTLADGIASNGVSSSRAKQVDVEPASQFFKRKSSNKLGEGESNLSGNRMFKSSNSAGRRIEKNAPSIASGKVAEKPTDNGLIGSTKNYYQEPSTNKPKSQSKAFAEKSTVGGLQLEIAKNKAGQRDAMPTGSGFGRGSDAGQGLKQAPMGGAQGGDGAAMGGGLGGGGLGGRSPGDRNPGSGIRGGGGFGGGGGGSGTVGGKATEKSEKKISGLGGASFGSNGGMRSMSGSSNGIPRQSGGRSRTESFEARGGAAPQQPSLSPSSGNQSNSVNRVTGGFARNNDGDKATQASLMPGESQKTELKSRSANSESIVGKGSARGGESRLKRKGENSNSQDKDIKSRRLRFESEFKTESESRGLNELKRIARKDKKETDRWYEQKPQADPFGPVPSTDALADKKTIKGGNIQGLGWGQPDSKFDASRPAAKNDKQSRYSLPSSPQRVVPENDKMAVAPKPIKGNRNKEPARPKESVPSFVEPAKSGEEKKSLDPGARGREAVEVPESAKQRGSESPDVELEMLEIEGKQIEFEKELSDQIKAKKTEEKEANLGVDQPEDEELAEQAPDVKLDFEFAKVDPSIENAFIRPIGTDAVSTFSVDTDTAAFSYVRQQLRSGKLPSPESVRIEEMVNYFDFKYIQPPQKEPFSVAMEVASSPWSPGNKILKVGLQAKRVDNDSRPPSNLVFLIDISGSMRAKNKLPLLKRGLKKMVEKLREDDYVGIVTYANQINVALEPTDGSQKDRISKAIDALKSGGGTNGGDGLRSAYQMASENFLPEGTNRIVLGTDGDFNIGIQNNVELAKFVKSKAESGVFLTVCGFGTDNFKDQKMQIMSQNGNGKVYYIDSEEEAQRVFADRISSSLVTVAKDVKLQLLFNPKKVQQYRLIGYENRMLAAEDFDDPTKDAGEMDAGDSVTALYEIVPSNGKFTIPTSIKESDPVDLKYQILQKQAVKLTEVAESDDLAALRIKFKTPLKGEVLEKEFTVKDRDLAFNRASKEYQLATAVAGLGMMLRGSQHRGGLNYDNLREFGQTVLADGPDSSNEIDTKKPGVAKEQAGANSGPQKGKADNAKSEALRRQQRLEVLELINLAADIYKRSSQPVAPNER